MFRVLAVFNKNVEQGAQTTIQCTVAEEVANDTGHYYKYVIIKNDSDCDGIQTRNS